MKLGADGQPIDELAERRRKAEQGPQPKAVACQSNGCKETCEPWVDEVEGKIMVPDGWFYRPGLPGWIDRVLLCPVHAPPAGRSA